MRRTTSRLRRCAPELSAATKPAVWLRVLAFSTLLVLASAAALGSDVLRLLLAGPAAIVLWAMAAWRIAALCAPAPPPPAPQLPWDALPRCTVLVPLMDEALTLPGLIAALDRLRYPRDRLEIVLLLEQTDSATRAAADRLDLPLSMRIVVVPDGQPRTKPRALAYGLAVTHGDIVTVFDAEDAPDQDQLLHAAAHLFADPGLGCVQARLAIVGGRSWWERQGAMDYAVLFGALLPTVMRAGAPAPLGGTSNYIPRRVLIEVGGWDPYNVTEDADLGVRLTRAGYRITMLDSQTDEEAPRTWRSWLGQRTRWFKGWMQTWLVHMRYPARLASDIGWRNVLCLQIVLGGPILLGLLHPVLTIAAMIDLAHATGGPSTLGPWLWTAGGAVAAFATHVALVIRHGPRPGVHWIDVAGLPLYWIAVSLASWRALWQLLHQPHVWEKTPHSPRPDVQPSDKAGYRPVDTSVD